MKTKRIIILFSIVAMTLLICRCGKAPEVQDEQVSKSEPTTKVTLTADQITMAGVTVGAPERKPISGTIRATGMLDVPPQQLISISVPLGGFVKDTKMLQGMRVRKGELIAVIENPAYIQLQQDYLEAKSQLDYAKADYERQEVLAKEKVNAQKTLQQASSNYQSWLAKRNGLAETLKMINIDLKALETGKISSTAKIYAPITGYVTHVNVNIGKYVDPQDVLFEIVDTEHLHAELVVFEKDIPFLKIGQRVSFTLANESKQRSATVYLIGRVIAEDRSVRIHCHIDEEDRELLPGMFLSAIIETGGVMSTVVPEDAVVQYMGKDYVFVPAGENTFRIVGVNPGHSEMGYTSLADADSLQLEKVVLKGAYTLLSVMKNQSEE